MPLAGDDKRIKISATLKLIETYISSVYTSHRYRDHYFHTDYGFLFGAPSCAKPGDKKESGPV
jgi:hypothetical protein